MSDHHLCWCCGAAESLLELESLITGYSSAQGAARRPLKHLSCRNHCSLPNTLLPLCAQSCSEPRAGSRCAEEGRAYEVGGGDSDPETDSPQARMELHMPEGLHEMPVCGCVMCRVSTRGCAAPRCPVQHWVCQNQSMTSSCLAHPPNWSGCSSTVHEMMTS